MNWVKTGDILLSDKERRDREKPYNINAITGHEHSVYYILQHGLEIQTLLHIHGINQNEGKKENMYFLFRGTSAKVEAKYWSAGFSEDQ